MDTKATRSPLLLLSSHRKRLHALSLSPHVLDNLLSISLPDALPGSTTMVERIRSHSARHRSINDMKASDVCRAQCARLVKLTIDSEVNVRNLVVVLRGLAGT